MSKSNFTIGVVVGVLAGAIAGLLTAPKSGKETRADLKKKSEELRLEAAKQSKLAKSKASELFGGAAQTAGEYKERSSNAVVGAVEGAKKGFNSKQQ